MDRAERHLLVVEIERQLLAALCAPAAGQQTRAEIFDRLATYAFADPDHDVIFGVLAKARRATAEHIRQTLSARLTRLGFPDIEVAPIFELAPPSTEEIQTLLRQLGR